MRKPATPLTERIIDALSNGPRGKVELRNRVVGKDFTYQGFYKALASLRAAEIVTLHRDTVSLSVVWLERERERIAKSADAYHLSGYQSYFGGLKNGKKLSFKFKTLRELDLFWTQAVLIAMQGAGRGVPIISFIPHDWFYLLRPSTADVWFKLLGKENPHVNILTHATREEKKLSEHPRVARIENMFGENPLRQKESAYMNVIGDLVIEAALDEAVVPGIRRAVRGEAVDIDKLTAQKGVFKLSIRRDSAKASVFTKKAQKYFSISL
ncbi:MAG: hypothetical protein WDN10_03390 [bacterium]